MATTWTPPSGSRLPGEAPDDGAQRELREETGLSLPLYATICGSGTSEWCAYWVEIADDARFDTQVDMKRGGKRMPGDADIAAVAAYLADQTRATMLLALSDGRAFTLSELARCARVAPSTASEHLSRLVDAELLAVVKQGRSRFYHLANPALVAIMEDLARLAPQVKIRSLSASEQAKALHRARMCYDHLAGTLGVLLSDALAERGILHPVDEGYVVDEEGMMWLRSYGITFRPQRKLSPYIVPWHVDWSERKHHVAGALGAALADRLFELQWLVRSPSSRAVHLTAQGKSGLEQTFGLRF